MCYESGDKIIIDKEDNLARFDLSKVKNFEVHAQLSREEFDRLRGFGQVIVADTSTPLSSVSTVELKQIQTDYSY